MGSFIQISDLDLISYFKVMGNCCKGPVYPQVPNARIESSLKVRREFPKPCSQKKWIVRDDSSAFGKYRGLDQLFDNIDCILHRTTVNPYIFLTIIILIGTAATIPMVIYDQMNNLWMPWVLPYISGLQPYMLAQVTMRRKKIIQLLGDWNRTEGSIQGIQVHLGTEDAVNYKGFFGSLDLCYRDEPFILICKQDLNM